MNQTGRLLITGMLIAAMGLCPLAGLAGCQTASTLDGGARNEPKVSYKEKTSLLFLTKAELYEYASKGKSRDLPFAGDAKARDAFKARLDYEFNTRDPSDRSPILIAVAVFLTGELIKLVVNHLKEVAKEYQATTGDKASGTQYFDKGEAKIDGFEFRRDVYEVTSDGKGGESEVLKVNTEQLIVLVRPAASRTPEGLFSLRPVYFQENHPKARVGGPRRMTSAVTITLDGLWTTPDGAVNGRLLEYQFAVQKYRVGVVKQGAIKPISDTDLGYGQAVTSLKDMNVESSWFALPIRDKVHAVGLNAAVSIHEVDNSKTAEFLTGIADFLNDGKSTVVDIVKTALDD